jgi:hypothetical protein
MGGYTPHIIGREDEVSRVIKKTKKGDVYEKGCKTQEWNP